MCEAYRKICGYLAGIFLILVCVFCLSLTVKAQSLPFGDINGGGQPELEDAKELGEYLKGVRALTEGQKTAGELNGDGRVSLDDSLLLLGYLSGQYPMLGLGRVEAFSEKEVRLSVGETAALRVLVASDLPSVSWSSDRPQIASVDDMGHVTAHRAGEAKIKALLPPGAVAEFRVRVTRSGRYFGIDVSEFQGEIDWRRVKESRQVDFAILRAGFAYGDEVTKDSQYDAYVRGAVDENIPIGAYLYAVPFTPQQARRQAEYLLELTKDTPLEYPLVMDLEDESLRRLSKRELTRIIDAFLETIRDAGKEPMLYTDLDFALEVLERDVLRKWDVWIADYNDTAPRTDFEYEIWQFSDNGRVDGIETRVDRNLSYVDFAGAKHNRPCPTVCE